MQFHSDLAGSQNLRGLKSVAKGREKYNFPIGSGWICNPAAKPSDYKSDGSGSYSFMNPKLDQRFPAHRDSDVMSGMPVFDGTRVSVQTLFDYLIDGCSLAEFLDNFPTVSRADAISVLECASAFAITRGIAR